MDEREYSMNNLLHCVKQIRKKGNITMDFKNIFHKKFVSCEFDRKSHWSKELI